MIAHFLPDYTSSSLSILEFNPFAMTEKIITIEALQKIVDLDAKDHKLKTIAEAFLTAMHGGRNPGVQ